MAEPAEFETVTTLASSTLPATSGPSVALALGAGGARGLAHIHVIETLDELGIRPVAISGSSIGAIMGAGMAAGISGRDIREHTLETIGKRVTIANRLWALGPTSMRDSVGGFRLGQFNLERILKAFLPDAIPDDFGDLQIPLKVFATDYFGQREIVCDSGNLIEALAASAAIPALFMPVRLNGRLTVDGGIFNPVPYETLRGSADVIIGVDVVGAPEGEEGAIPKRIDSLFGASQLMMQSNIALKLQLGAPDIFLRPPVNRYRVLDFLKARQILEETEVVREELKRALDACFERLETVRD